MGPSSTLSHQPARTGRFNRNCRLLKRADFERIQNSGQKLYSKFFLVLVQTGSTTLSRIGITVTKKVAQNAVDRNRIKRRVRDLFRRHRGSFKGILDVIVVARRDAHHCTMQEVERNILGALRQHGYLNE